MVQNRVKRTNSKIWQRLKAIQRNKTSAKDVAVSTRKVAVQRINQLKHTIDRADKIKSGG